MLLFSQDGRAIRPAVVFRDVTCSKLPLAAEVATCVSRDPELDKEYKIISTGEATAGVGDPPWIWEFWSFQKVHWTIPPLFLLKFDETS